MNKYNEVFVVLIWMRLTNKSKAAKKNAFYYSRLNQ